ncbi:sporulation integral membrane protein YtvI [Paenibacillus tarimensis]|uniref:sporulation integral membrane protein YtvI n=1 Tax=Paenibacillus tarimensis TaxID=416012 RepID=UPI001F3FF784|nr:sporulation integral membrane protein YtvI [Paenibacillus tarimensis]MCF2943898.1 sporulation integral membrane protein YtvI [Paenibacillus tarimensis]
MDRVFWQRTTRALWVAAFITAVVLAIMYLTPIVYPFVLGWLLAYLLNPLINWLQRRARFPRWLAVISTLLVAVGLISGIATALVSRIVNEIIYLSGKVDTTIAWWGETIQKLMERKEIQNLTNHITEFYEKHPEMEETIKTNAAESTTVITDALSQAASFFFNFLIRMIYSLPTFAMISVIVVMAAFFMSKDWYRYTTRVNSWFPTKIRRMTFIVTTNVQKALFGYIRTQLIIISITAVLIIIGLLILRVPYAVTIGLLIGLVDLLPYLGVGLVFVPWIIYVFFYGDVSLGIGLSVLFIVIVTARQIIEPKVLASSVGMEPLPMLISMFVGLKLFGVLGLIIGPVALVVLTAFQKADVFRDTYYFIKYGQRRK